MSDPAAFIIAFACIWGACGIWSCSDSLKKIAGAKEIRK